ncbi:hypothetical protein D3C73_1505360 [compost metagenome]
MQAHGGPLRTRLQTPADMGDAVHLGIVEVLHVIAQVFGLEATMDRGNEALFDFQGDLFSRVVLERQQDIADVDHQDSLGGFLVWPGE